MNRLSMAWIVPTVMGMLALTVSGSVQPQEAASDSSSSRWNHSAAEAGEPEIKRLPETAKIKAEETLAEETAVKKDQQAANSESANQAIELNSNLESANEEDVVNDETPLLTAEEQQATKKIEKAQTRNSLDQQFKKLQKTLETSDAYSLELAEDYFGYGLLLRDDGQLDEALEAFVDALHIQKVNHGIYSPEQRPALKALFETHYSMGNTEGFEDNLERILWIESKNPDLVDDMSYKMLVKVGNRYIDQFLRKPVAGQGAVQTLLRAKNHLNAAYSRSRKKPLSVLLMPYGELALISFLEHQLRDRVDQTMSMEDPRLYGSRNLDGRELALYSYLTNSFPRGLGLLKSYLKKAQREKNLHHTVRALISLGDFNQLFRRNADAAEYYKLAWVQAQNLDSDDTVLAKFAKPVALPAFDYAQQRESIIPTKPTVVVPMTLDIGKDGRVTKIFTDQDNANLRPYYARARRIARRTVFRPAIVDGELQASTQLSHQTRVYARKGAKKVEAEKEEKEEKEKQE